MISRIEIKFRFFTLLFLLCTLSATLNAQESTAIELVPEHVHALKIDTTTHKKGRAYSLITGDDHPALSGFLNNFRSTENQFLKSAASSVRLDSIVSSEWSEETMGVEKFSKTRFDANKNGHEMYVRDYKWNDSRNNWLISQGDYYFFNENGQLDSTEFQEYVTTAYRRYIRTKFTYENGVVRYALRHEKIDEIDVWEQLDRTEYVYDSEDRLSFVYSQKWDIYDKNWGTFFYIEYVYDDSGKLVRENAFDFDSYEGLASKKYEIVYEYDDEGRLIRVTENVKGWQENQFVPDRKVEKSYDANASLISDEWFEFDYDSGDWLPEKLLKYNWESTGSLLHGISEKNWADQWIDERSSDYFAENFLVVQDVQNWEFLEAFLPVYSFGSTVCERIEKSVYLNGISTDAGKTNYYFSNDVGTGVESESNTGIRFFPNPANDRLIVESGGNADSELFIYNLTGQVQKSCQMYGTQSVDVSDLAPGVYVIEVRRKSQTIFTGKLVKK